MATYNNTIDIDYDHDGDSLKVGTEKIVTQLDAIYVILNAIDAAYKAAAAEIESDYAAADAEIIVDFEAADTALDAAYQAADAALSAALTPKFLIVADTKSSGTAGGSMSAGWQYRTINTVEHNGISGASVAGNVITLPVGTYLVDGRVPGCACRAHKASLQLQGGAPTDLVVGSPEYSPDNDLSTQKHNTWSKISGKFTISEGATTVMVRHYVEQNDSSSSAAAGKAYNAPGLSEVYTWLKFQKIA